MKLLIHLLSDQILPNAIATALLQPDRCVCLDTGKFSHQVSRLATVSGLPHDASVFSAYDLEANVAAVSQLLAAHKQDDVWINFTGGTKMMALSAVVLGLQHKCHCVYVDTTRRRLVEIDRTLHSTPLATAEPQLALGDLIVLAGETEISNSGQDDAMPRWNLCCSLQRHWNAGALTHRAAELRSANKKALPAGNLHVDKAEAVWNGASLKVTLARKDNPPEVFDVMHPEPHAFLAGGWREEFVALSLVRSRVFREVRLNVRLEWSRETLQRIPPQYDATKNELDVFALFGWRPAIIECKSGTYDAGTLHKLKFLRDHLCGSFGVAILALATDRPVGADISEKARDQGIHVIAGAAWKNLAQHVAACCQADQPQAFLASPGSAPRTTADAVTQ